ncbi:MAG: ribose-phosphate diphosphokinase [Proteobacteria bacterium]|nr:ribose-phosphate diphosphokinase [Pseudomonadota bacterium]
MPILINGVVIERSIFPGGEINTLLHNSIVNNIEIIAHLHSSDDIMQLFLVCDAARQISRDIPIRLIIPYLPYGRQDKVRINGEPLGARVIANIINSLNCYEVIIYDPHSKDAVKYINNCKIISSADIICKNDLADEIIKKEMILVGPDLGSIDKIEALQEMLCTKYNLKYDIQSIYFSKTRDTKTTTISRIKIDERYACNVKNKKCIIIDDICDGGATAVLAAKELKKHKANQIMLYITHGIFSKGFNRLQKWISHIYCANIFNLKSIENQRRFITPLIEHKMRSLY